MPDLIRHPEFFWIALKLHFVPRLRGNDNLRVFIRRSNNLPDLLQRAASVKNRISNIEQEISNSRRKIKHFGIRHAAARFEKKLKLTALAIN
jgi:hypothetical protein